MAKVLLRTQRTYLLRLLLKYLPQICALLKVIIYHLNLGLQILNIRNQNLEHCKYILAVIVQIRKILVLLFIIEVGFHVSHYVKGSYRIADNFVINIAKILKLL